MSERLLRRQEVEQLVRLRKTALYDWIARGLFPRPVLVGNRSVAWRASDIDKWISSRPERGER